MIEKEYIGDSVYVEVENGMLRLTTDNGLGPTNEIFLEPVVYEGLVRYAERVIEAAKAPPPSAEATNG